MYKCVNFYILHEIFKTANYATFLWADVMWLSLSGRNEDMHLKEFHFLRMLPDSLLIQCIRTLHTMYLTLRKYFRCKFLHNFTYTSPLNDLYVTLCILYIMLFYPHMKSVTFCTVVLSWRLASVFLCSFLFSDCDFWSATTNRFKQTSKDSFFTGLG